MKLRLVRGIALVGIVAGCGRVAADVGETGGAGGTGGTGATGGTTGGTDQNFGGSNQAVGGSDVGEAGQAPSTGGTSAGGGPDTGGTGVGGSSTGAVGGDSMVMGGSAGAQAGGSSGSGVDATGGTGGSDVPIGGMPGTGGAEVGSAGMGIPEGGSAGMPPYSARTGPFKMLAYSKTSGFRHVDAINAGKTMLMAMGTKQGFEVTFSEDPSDFTSQSLAQYEIVFGLNPTGNNLSNEQKAAFEEWMTKNNGAFAGVHAATDHENGWAFYSEVTGQYHDGHDTCCPQGAVEWDPRAVDFIAVKGLPSPWQRGEEWFKFNSSETWAAKPGFQILSRITTSASGTRPVSYVREYQNFRSFYTSLGHEGATYSDANFIKHVSAGIMWAVRREALYVP